MEIDKIKELMKIFHDTNISELNVETECYKVNMKKELTQSVIQTQKVCEMIQEETKTELPSNTTSVKAPLVGVFYSKSSPDAKPFVEVGKTVKQGDTLCIIEAMKVMNEIKAPCSGVIQAILVEDEELVEFDKVLMQIQG